MFYSHDLLGRKTPLGAIWTLAHGRKLSKGKIISINLREICQEILQPGVPHSLRLQGILIGGVVIVYNKQQAYLLEDLQEMMRRVKAAGKSATAEGGAAATTAGKNTLKKDKNQARLEAITLMDMEDLLAPTADLGVGDDFLGLLDGGFSGMTGSDVSGSRNKKRRKGDALEGEEEVADGLFIMPSMPANSDRSNPERSRSRSVSWAAGLQERDQQQQEEVYGGLGADLNQWNPADEMFDMNTQELDLLGGMDLPVPAPAQTTSDTNRPADSAATRNTRATATTSNLEQENPYDPTLLPETEQHPMDIDMEQQQFDQGAISSLGLHRDEAALSDSQLVADEARAPPDDAAAQADRDQEEAEGAKKTARKQRKRKLGQAFVDDLDNLQIKSRDYREWVTDHTSLINQDRKKATALGQAAINNGNNIVNSILSVNPQALLDPSVLMSFPAALVGGLGAAGPHALGAGVPSGLRLAPELLDLFKAPVLAANAGVKAKRPPAPSSPEVNNSTGDGMLPGNRHGEVHRDALHLTRIPGEDIPDDDEVQGRHMHMTLPDNFEMQDDELHHRHDIDLPPGMDLPEGAELLSNDEAHDQLMNLPYEGEIERLRAAGPGSTGTHSGSLHLSSPSGTTVRTAGQKSVRSDTTSDSDMIPQGRAQGTGLKRALRMDSQDLDGVEGAGAGMFYGAGNLEDLLPDVPMPDSDAEQPSAQAGGVAGSGHRSASVPLSSVPSSQFPLIEETEPLQETQHQQPGHITKATQTVLNVFRKRLQAPDAEAAANNAAGNQLSLFGLMKDGQLSRSAAAKLFYQVCVTTNAGYVTVKQERAFGDIMIEAGRNLWSA